MIVDFVTKSVPRLFKVENAVRMKPSKPSSSTRANYIPVTGMAPFRPSKQY